MRRIIRADPSLQAPLRGEARIQRVLDDEGTGMQLDLLRGSAGARFRIEAGQELGLMLYSGEVRINIRDHRWTAARSSLFDENGFAWSVAGGDDVEIEFRDAGELSVFRTRNPASFEARCFGPSEVRVDRRGEHGADGAAFRFVRTYYDVESHPDARLVMGEVVNLAGRWSSYPPHHHPQPEVYHYRFDRTHGFGHAEHGDEVFKVKDRDTLCIAPHHTHAQCAAPGYAMFYQWVIRQTPELPYRGPTFEDAHRWLLSKEPTPRRDPKAS
ncbi:MAG: 5-deoxy-glucuronate isomerase [Myxococcota bacterium]